MLTLPEHFRIAHVSGSDEDEYLVRPSKSTQEHVQCVRKERWSESGLNELISALDIRVRAALRLGC
jgi:hypothetical protein